ncbi:OsmC family protein [Flavobacteriaceae bacterium]|nr:OsmC family protein [Flavobacteriaceae bacterium]
MKQLHNYNIQLTWIGNLGKGTSKFNAYKRDYQLDFENKPSIIGSADPTFHGDKELYNPEEMLLAALASCHMMSFFYLCSKNKVSIHNYEDNPCGVVKLNTNGSGQFEEVILQPKIITNGDLKLTQELFEQANEYCFIARSCNFKITHQATITHTN